MCPRTGLVISGDRRDQREGTGRDGQLGNIQFLVDDAMAVQRTLEMRTAGGSMEIAIGAWNDNATSAGTLMLIACFYHSF